MGRNRSGRLRWGRDVKECTGGVQFPTAEQADRAVLAVVAGVLDHLAAAQPGHGFAEQTAAGPAHLGDGRLAQDREFRAQRGDEPAYFGADFLTLGAGSEDLTHNLRQRDQVGGAGRSLRPAAHGPVGEFGDPVQHADGERFAALRTDPAVLHGLAWLEANPALAVPVQVVTAALGEEIDRPGQTCPSPQGGLDREIVDFGG